MFVKDHGYCDFNEGESLVKGLEGLGLEEDEVVVGRVRHVAGMLLVGDLVLTDCEWAFWGCEY